jgi:hypothetical protein
MYKPKLLNAKELYQLADEALDLLYGDDETDRLEENLRSDQIFTALTALRFCATNAAALKEVSLLPILVRSVDALDWYYDESRDLLYLALRSLRTLLPLASELPQEVLSLASHRQPEVRAALAEGLLANNAQTLSLLETLATDSSAEVRRPAQKKLASLRDIPWWIGKFSADPLLQLSEEERPACQPLLHELAALLDLTRASSEQLARFLVLAAQLPEVILFDLARVWLADYEQVRRWPRALLGVILQRAGGGAVVWELMRLCWSNAGLGFAMGYTLSDIINELPPEKRASLCLELLEYLSVPEDAAAKHSPRVGLTDTINRSWPAERDPSPFLEAILSEKPGAAPLSELFKRPELNITPVLSRFVEAHLAGYPGPWKSLSSQGPNLISRAPVEILRGATEIALQSADDNLVIWGLHQQLGPLYDEQRQPPLYVLVEQLFAIPRYYGLFYENSELRQRALPLVRSELLSTPLSFYNASLVLSSIDAVYGGLAPMILFFRDLDDKAQKQEKLAPFFAPTSLGGPITVAEWQRYRALRDAVNIKDDPKEAFSFWGCALHRLPEGPLPSEDKLFLQSALTRYQAGEKIPQLWLCSALVLDPQPESLPFLEQIASGEHAGLIDGLQNAIKILKGTKTTSNAEPPTVGWLEEEDE